MLTVEILSSVVAILKYSVPHSVHLFHNEYFVWWEKEPSALDWISGLTAPAVARLPSLDLDGEAVKTWGLGCQNRSKWHSDHGQKDKVILEILHSRSSDSFSNSEHDKASDVIATNVHLLSCHVVWWFPDLPSSKLVVSYRPGSLGFWGQKLGEESRWVCSPASHTSSAAHQLWRL